MDVLYILRAEVTLKAKHAAAKAHGMRALGMWTPDATRWDKALSAAMWGSLPAPNKTERGDGCTALLRASCPSQGGTAACDGCVARHFSALAAAGCTTAEVQAYCGQGREAPRAPSL